MKFTPPIPSCSNENFCFHVGDYSFGFNGKELDKEGMGGGASTYDYGFRIYNSALAKFLSVDPLTCSFPYLTPYQFSSNMPISSIDLDGLEAQIVVYSPYFAKRIKKAVDSGDIQEAIRLSVLATLTDSPDDEYSKRVFKGQEMCATYNYNEVFKSGLQVFNSNGDLIFHLYYQEQREIIDPLIGEGNILELCADFGEYLLHVDQFKTYKDLGGYFFTSVNGQGQEMTTAVDHKKVEGPINIDLLMSMLGSVKDGSGVGVKNVEELFSRWYTTFLYTKEFQYASGLRGLLWPEKKSEPDSLLIEFYEKHENGPSVTHSYGNQKVGTSSDTIGGVLKNDPSKVIVKVTEK